MYVSQKRVLYGFLFFLSSLHDVNAVLYITSLKDALQYVYSSEF